MQRSFGGTAFEPVQKRRDTELTLGPGMLLSLGLGLFILCSICFVFGYAVGHRVTPTALNASAGPVTAAQKSAQDLLTAQPQANKPTASQSGIPMHTSTQPAAAAPIQDDSEDDNSPKVSRAAAPPPASRQPATVAAPASASALVTQPAALQTVAASPAATRPAVVAASPVVHPALPQAAAPQSGSWMVQIAAVSHTEDADVLVGALRKKGYAVSVHRDPTDALMHVQVGPFGSHNDATTMRQKLINDGYNAMIQP